MSFVGNNRKFPLKDLTGDPETDARLLREHFERLKAYAPRIIPRDSGNEAYAGTKPTSTTWVTITPTSPPVGAVGCTVYWQTITANAVNTQWRQDSADTGRSIGHTGPSRHASNFNAFFSTPSAQTFDLRFAAAPGTITENSIQITGWIF